MKMIIFISVFFIVLGLAGYYVYIRIGQAFAGNFVSSKAFLIAYLFLVSSFFLGKLFEILSIGFFSTSLIKIGSVGAGFFIYGLLFFIFFDIIRLINYIIPFFPSFITVNYEKTKLIIGSVSLLIISVIFISGYLNAQTIRVKELSVKINKNKASFETLNVVAVSDIHLGIAVNEKATTKLIDKINELKPDLVLIGGDIVDDNLKVVKHFKLIEKFSKIESKYGVYSCLGNHEYIGKAYKENDLAFFEQNGIHMLKDTSVKIDNKFYIIGRDDVEGKMTTGNNRKTLEELTKDIDFELPVFLLDHQPFKLEQTAEYAVDFQFSGHTHNGQFWPFNYITGLLFEEDWGYLQKKNTHFYISSGFGTAVVPIKVGNHSEIVNIKFTNE